MAGCTDLKALVTDMAWFAQHHPEHEILCNDEVGVCFRWTAFAPGAQFATKSWEITPKSLHDPFQPWEPRSFLRNGDGRRQLPGILRDPKALAKIGIRVQVRTRWDLFREQLDAD